MTTPYTTVDSVKTKLGISLDPDVALDAELDALILSVSALFDTMVFGPEATSGFLPATAKEEYHDGDGAGIVLRHLLTEDDTQRALVTVSENEIDLPIDDRGWHIDQFPGNTVYRTSPSTVDGDVLFNRSWAPGNRNIKIIYAPAYTILPNDVIRATDEETARAYKGGTNNTTDGGSIGITGRTPDAGTAVQYTIDDLTATTLRMLDGYRKRLSFF